MAVSIDYTSMEFSYLGSSKICALSDDSEKSEQELEQAEEGGVSSRELTSICEHREMME